MSEEDWAVLLEQVGHRTFVGRRQEREVLETFLQDRARRLLHVHGPAGIGKTALLDQYARDARERGWRTVDIDAELIEPTAAGVEHRFEPLLDAQAEPPTLGLIDNIDALAGLHPWLRRKFLPRLPSSVRLVSAARSALPDQWLTAPGWNQLLVSIKLDPLSEEESEKLLSVRQVRPERQEELLAFARGYPLALVVAADTTLRRGDEPFCQETAIEDLELLLRRLRSEAPSERHRQALELSSLVRRTTEPLLARVLGVDDASDLLRWLAQRPFFDGDGRGFRPHQLIRRLLSEEMRLYEETRRSEMLRRTMAYYFEASEKWTKRAHEDVLLDLGYLLRDEVLADWAPVEAQRFELARPRDAELDACLDMVRRFEGEHSAELARHWQAEQPEGLVVVRDEQDSLSGFCHFLEFDEISDAEVELDPALKLTRDYLHEAPLRDGETTRVCRYWMSEKGYQAWNGVQTRLFLHISRKVALAPGVALGLTIHAHPERWMDRPDNQLRSFGRFEVEDIEYVLLGRDWRKIQRMEWLRGMFHAMMGRPKDRKEPTPTVLAREPFGAAVKRALKHFHRGDRLAANPLVDTPLVSSHTGGAPTAEQRIETLRELLEEACTSLGETGGDKLHVVILQKTYLDTKARTQQEIAGELEMAYGTYRYHLGRAVERVAEYLWALEREITGV